MVVFCPFSIENGVFEMECSSQCAIYDQNYESCSFDSSRLFIREINIAISLIKEKLGA